MRNNGGSVNRYIAGLSVGSAIVFGGVAWASSAGSSDATLSINDVNILESDTGSTTAYLTVSLASAVAHGDITVGFFTIAGTATEGTSCTTGVDYIGAHNRTLTLNSRQMSGRISIQVCGDTRYEPTETFIVTLLGASGAVITKSDGLVRIVNNDPAPVPWGGLIAEGKIAKAEEQHWQTPVVPAGDYLFTLTNTSGDADLYIRIGSQPTLTAYDCRPAKSGDETCLLRLNVPAAIFVTVRGYAPSSTFKLTGAAK